MKKTYWIEVDCANCAAKMESAVREIPGVVTAVVNYMTQKMTVEFAPEADVAATLKVIEKTCSKIDRDFVLYR